MNHAIAEKAFAQQFELQADTVGEDLIASIAGVASSQSTRFWAYWDGTVMEQRGRNGWQTFGSPKRGKWLDLAPNRCQRLPPVAV
jgi:hypothetical protein